MKYVEGFDRNQAILFPQCIDEIIPQDSEVRIIDLFVDSLPLQELGFMDHIPVDDGRPMYHPKDLLKLYIYGYLNRIRTSRLLERECERNVELIWLLKGLRPCFRTIAGFRSAHPEAFRNVFRHVVNGMNKTGLLGKKVVAIDGTKFRAVNSKKNNYNRKKINRQLAYIDERVEQFVSEMDKGDLSEDETARLEQKISNYRRQKRKYKKLEKQLSDSGQEQISTTDPDARSMVIHGQVVEVCFNVQTVVDDKHNLVVEYNPTNRNDKKALVEMARRAKRAMNVRKLTAIADKGYHNGEQLHSCASEDVITYVAVPDPPRNSPIPTPAYYGEKFRYNKTKDTYTCPKGKTLKSNGQWYERKYDEYITRIKHYKTPACKSCPVLAQCTSNENGRVLERSEYAEAAEKNTRRVRKHPSIYSARQQIIEHVFGTIKRQWGYDHILLKGLTKNDGEFGLIYLVYNLRRIINILGFKNAKIWVKKILFSIFKQLVRCRSYWPQKTNRFLAQCGIRYQM
jgi:transposase